SDPIGVRVRSSGLHRVGNHFERRVGFQGGDPAGRSMNSTLAGLVSVTFSSNYLGPGVQADLGGGGPLRRKKMAPSVAAISKATSWLRWKKPFGARSVLFPLGMACRASIAVAPGSGRGTFVMYAAEPARSPKPRLIRLKFPQVFPKANACG